LDGKIRGLVPRGCGPRRPGPPWTGSQCRVPDEVAGRGAEEEEGSTGVPVQGPPGLRRWRSSGATMVKAALEERLVRAHSGHRERGRRGGGGAVGGADAGVPFYRFGGGAVWVGVREEWVVPVVCHNGDEGGRFRRGLDGVVVGTDEGGCSGRYGSGSGIERWHVHKQSGSSGGRPKEEDDWVGPVCQPGTERREGGAR
jgi:hypothetical protein